MHRYLNVDAPFDLDAPVALAALALTRCARLGAVVASRFVFAIGDCATSPRGTFRSGYSALLVGLPIRPVPMLTEGSPLALEALRPQRVRQAEDRLAAGSAYEACGFVFADPLGQRLHPRNVTAAFRRTAQRLKLSTTALKSLRHTCATWMIGAGVDVRTAAAVLGHASPTVTLTTYAHLIDGAQAAAVATIGDRLQRVRKVAE